MEEKTLKEEVKQYFIAKQEQQMTIRNHRVENRYLSWYILDVGSTTVLIAQQVFVKGKILPLTFFLIRNNSMIMIRKLRGLEREEELQFMTIFHYKRINTQIQYLTRSDNVLKYIYVFSRRILWTPVTHKCHQYTYIILKL